MRYTEYFQEYAKYFGRALRLLKSIYGMTNYGKLFADKLKLRIVVIGDLQNKEMVEDTW